MKFYTLSIITAFLFIFLFLPSCLFDKEIKQDKQIAVFKYKLIKVQDSLDNHISRVNAYKTIIEEIDNDEYLITPRKKNNLLIEGNNYLSNEYLKEKNYDKAIHYSNIIINTDPAYPKGYYTRGCIYQVMEEDSLALVDYNTAIDLYQDYAEAYYNRGIIYEEQGKYDKALADYNRVIKFSPPFLANVYNNRGNVYLAKDDKEKAIGDYTKTITIDSTNTMAYCNRALVYIQQKEYDKALADCNKVILLDTLNVNAYSKRASIYELTKDYPEAIDDYVRIMKLDSFDKFGMLEMSKQAIQRLKPLVAPVKKTD
ncbi:MAG: tetratricopeptide repeat protein [Prevotella sp.]|jgi:tetratricopeptide (TPR) repeat protein|nr:tetratricopeptide repeat protein [Prevotella sp.]